MMNTHPVCVISVYEAASAKVSFFRQSIFEEHMRWLEEIQEEAGIAFGSESISLLPKTPGVKRKRLDSRPVEELNNSLGKHTSTFVDGGKTKKLKIDDMSTIIESTYIEESVLDDTNNSSKISRSLRPRRKKTSNSRPLKKSKRLANLSKIDYTVKDTPESLSPRVRSQINVNSSNKTIVCSDTVIEQPSPLIVVISPINNHTVQPRVAALIERLKLSSQKQLSKDVQITKPLDDIKTTLFPTAECSEVSPLKIDSPRIDSSSTPAQSCVVSMERISVANVTSFSSPLTSHISLIPSQPPIVFKSTPKDQNVPFAPKETCQKESSDQENKNDLNDSSGEREPAEKDEETAKNELTFVKEVEQIVDAGKDHNDQKMEVDSGVSSDENNHQPSGEDSEPLSNAEPSIREEAGRRDTYKVMVKEMELPNKASSMRIQPFKEITREIVVDNQEPHGEKNAQDVNGSKTSKYKKGGNIVVGIKSFINKGHTEDKKTQEEEEEEKRRKMQAKEISRGKAVNEANDRKQKVTEMKKKQREEREKRFALQYAKRVEEEERRRQLLEQKERQVKKNQEEIKKQKEDEERKKRAIREMKQNEAEARRLKEEEDHRRKVREQIVEEERRQEMMQRKADYEEQLRLKKRVENGKAEKERFKLIEEERALYEDRKKREFEEKEEHRLMVEKKLKDEKEKEKLERIQREERLKLAVKEFEAAKKREMDQQPRAILREEIQSQIKNGPQTGGKVLVNMKNATRNSPRLLQNKENTHSPLRPKPQIYNPPVVPIKVRKSVYTSYSIGDLGSDDSTDDESEPTKRVPSWAQGMELRTHLMQQFYANINPDNIFVNCMPPCRLDKIFQKNKERYFRRTSSAHWDSPILKQKGCR